MALGCWDASLAQALAAQVAERHLSHDHEAERHGQPASEQQQQQLMCSITRAAHATMNTMEKKAFNTLLQQQPGGEETLCKYLAEPGLCGACLTLQEPPLVVCGRNCGRQLCPECRSEDNTCSNIRICNQPHPAAWRAAIKLLPRDSQIVAQWQAAAERAGLHTQHVRRLRRQADQTIEPSI